jgi:hypothetical protein
MKQITKYSFLLLKISASGFIIIYLLAVLMVGAAGHSGDFASLGGALAYSILLILLLNKYQKTVNKSENPNSIVKVALSVFIIPIIGLSLFFIFMIGSDLVSGKPGYIGITIFVILILLTFSGSGLIVVKDIFCNQTKGILLTDES